jgi:hypothetical protein
MSICKFFLFGLSLIEAFITPYNFIKPPKLTRCTSVVINKNISLKYNIYKLNFKNNFYLINFFIYLFFIKITIIYYFISI